MTLAALQKKHKKKKKNSSSITSVNTKWSLFAGCYRHSPKGWQGKKHEIPIPANFVCSGWVCWFSIWLLTFVQQSLSVTSAEPADFMSETVCRGPRLGGGILVMALHHDNNNSKTAMLPQLIFMEPCLWTGTSAFWVSQILRALLWHKQIYF